MKMTYDEYSQCDWFPKSGPDKYIILESGKIYVIEPKKYMLIVDYGWTNISKINVGDVISLGTRHEKVVAKVI